MHIGLTNDRGKGYSCTLVWLEIYLINYSLPISLTLPQKYSKNRSKIQQVRIAEHSYVLLLACMDWITFIKWNGIVYATYYGANLLVDFIRIKNQYAPKSSSTAYHLKDFGLEEPKAVRSSDFLYVDKKKKDTEPEMKISPAKENQKDNEVSFNAPIERQGIPVNEFAKTAHLFSTEIYKPIISS